MSQSLSRILIHLVFSTKDRRSLILPPAAPQLYAYFGGLLNRRDCVPILAGGMPDHVHVLFALSRNVALADLVEDFKKYSSRWIKSTPDCSPMFSWQRGYSAFSVSESQVSRVKAYIDGQAEHHVKRSFQDELRALLRRHGIQFDERYVWD